MRYESDPFEDDVERLMCAAGWQTFASNTEAATDYDRALALKTTSLEVFGMLEVDGEEVTEAYFGESDPGACSRGWRAGSRFALCSPCALSCVWLANL